jgi:hypothetical protein
MLSECDNESVAQLRPVRRSRAFTWDASPQRPPFLAEWQTIRRSIGIGSVN